jgi:hypothetical protein
VTTSASFDVDVRLAIQHAFLAGRPTPTVRSVASELDASEGDVAAAFDRLAAAHVIVLFPGTRELRMSAPFAGGPTDFVVTVEEQTYHANCVWDALGVAAMLGGDGRPVAADVRTTCADCGAPLALAVRDGAIRADPADAVAHFAVPAARWWADIGFT